MLLWSFILTPCLISCFCSNSIPSSLSSNSQPCPLQHFQFTSYSPYPSYTILIPSSYVILHLNENSLHPTPQPPPLTTGVSFTQWWMVLSKTRFRTNLSYHSSSGSHVVSSYIFYTSLKKPLLRISFFLDFSSTHSLQYQMFLHTLPFSPSPLIHVPEAHWCASFE